MSRLYYYPDPCLRIVCTPVSPHYLKTNPEFFELLLNDMWEIMEAHNGIGLAAPQIGSGVRAIIIKIPGGKAGRNTQAGGINSVA